MLVLVGILHERGSNKCNSSAKDPHGTKSVSRLVWESATHAKPPFGHSQEFPLEPIELVGSDAADLGIVCVCAEYIALRFRTGAYTSNQETVNCQR